MANENERHADIIAEMRNEGHTGPADALEWVRVKMTHYADRLEAAHKREVVALRTRVDMLRFGIEQYRQYHARVVKEYESKICDTAKLREAVGYIAQYADSAAMRQHDATTQHYIEQMRKWATAALAAPVRNCDMPLVVDGPADNNADKAWLVFKRHNPDAYFDVSGLLRCIDWLLAPAKEQEGGNNGR